MSKLQTISQAQPVAFQVRLARTEADLRAVQRLRYGVFAAELGATGAGVDAEAGLEADRLDPYADHLMLMDHRADSAPRLAGTCRLLRAGGAASAGGFYTEGEYDLSGLKASGRPLMELGRACLGPDYRGGTGLMHLWQGVADYVADHRIGLIFGVASFHGTDAGALAGPLALLHHQHLAEDAIRPRARAGGYVAMDALHPDQIDRKSAARAVPTLIKSYLRMGGKVGEGAYLDQEFNCIDVCMILDAQTLNQKHKAIYARATA